MNVKWGNVVVDPVAIEMRKWREACDKWESSERVRIQCELWEREREKEKRHLTIECTGNRITNDKCKKNY